MFPKRLHERIPFNFNDLLILNLHTKHTGFCIEFKNPGNYYKVSPEQNEMLEKFKMQNYKVLLSNDYDFIIKELIEYFQGVRIKCVHCTRKLKNVETMKTHIKEFHRIK